MTDDVVDSLYARPLDEFVAARNEAAKKARRDGDTVTATRLTSLSKPTVAAWTVNQVVRQYPDDVEKLLGIGAEMRTATAARDGAELARLNRARRSELDTFVAKSTKSGKVAGRSVTPETIRKLGETLEAAIISPEAGEAVAAGRLTQALQHVGFGVVDEDGAPADVVSLSAARAARRPPLTVLDGDAGDTDADAEADTEADAAHETAEDAVEDEDTAAERALAEAEDEVDAATAELDRLEGERDDAVASARDASDAVAEVRGELDRVIAEIAELEAERERLDGEVKTAQKRADQAEKASRALDDDIAAAERRAETARKRRREARSALRS